MNLRKAISIVGVGAALLAAGGVGAQELPRELERVVVLGVTGPLDAAEQARVEAALVAAASTLGLAAVMGPTEIADRLGEHQAPAPCHKAQCAARLGSDLGATTAILSRVRPGARKVLELELISTVSGKVKETHSVALPQRADLWDREVRTGLRAAFGAAPARSARASVGFARAEARVAGDYRKLKRVLLNRQVDLEVKLATVAAFLEAHDRSDAAELGEAKAAHLLLEARRTDLRRTSDLECSARPDCKERGLCKGGDFGCVAGGTEHCRSAQACERHGLCSFEAGACVATEMDCSDTYDCRNRGACTARAGVCMAANDVDCQRSSRCELAGICYATAGECVERGDVATAQR